MPIFKDNLLCLELSNSDNTPYLENGVSENVWVKPTRYSIPKFANTFFANSFLKAAPNGIAQSTLLYLFIEGGKLIYSR